MYEVEIFENVDFGKLRGVVINGEPWFVGKDIATALGYGEGKSLANAVANHVDDDDKGVTEMMTPGGKQKTVIVNESGVYSLVFGSKLPTAKKFKHWVTSEVLPTLRRTGSYTKQPKDDERLTELRIKKMDAETANIIARTNYIKMVSENPVLAKSMGYIPDEYEQPKSNSEATYRATDIAKELGVSAVKIGHAANKLGLKNEKYGRFANYRYCKYNKNTQMFLYNSLGLEELRKHFNSIA